MATFLTRVELHDATYQNYVELHGFMAQEGYSTTIRGGDGKVYQLPPAEYHLAADCTIEEARERASRAAKKTRRNFAVLVSQYSQAAWVGLQQVQERASA
jgi:hypothetical protein